MLKAQSLFRRWPCAVVLFVTHAMLMLLFIAGFATDRDPNSGLLWLFPYFGDFPSSLVSEWLLGQSASLTPRVATYLVLGGIQWTIIGLVFDVIYKWIGRTSAHDTPDI
jgi:hypothetical protein